MQAKTGAPRRRAADDRSARNSLVSSRRSVVRGACALGFRGPGGVKAVPERATGCMVVLRTGSDPLSPPTAMRPECRPCPDWHLASGRREALFAYKALAGDAGNPILAMRSYCEYTPALGCGALGFPPDFVQSAHRTRAWLAVRHCSRGIIRFPAMRHDRTAWQLTSRQNRDGHSQNARMRTSAATVGYHNTAAN